MVKAGKHLSEDAVKQYALKNAPAYQHPRHVWFVERVPLSSTNKVDRAVLKGEAETRIAAKVS
jgi:acyl-CoA synthetase (AMP-forming)/AMP-acid ligase II